MSPTKKTPARKATKKVAKPAVKKATKKVATSKAAAKQPAPKKAATKKLATKKAATKKVAAKKVVAKKAPAKKAASKKAAPARKSKQAPVFVATADSVDAYIGAIADPGRRQDCRTLVEVFGQATGKKPKLWGASIVAFGKYHYKYGSGHEGDSCLAGFASRKGALSLYLMGAVAEQKALLASLGKHKTGKGCIYLKDLEGIDLQVLGELVQRSAEYIRARYPTSD